MNYSILTVLLLFILACSCNRDTQAQEAVHSQTSMTQSFYDFKMSTLDGQEVDFSQYRGKKVLVVNTASECGFTPQYKDLQALHEQWGHKVAVLGFPSNNFGGQEPGSNEEIAQFCQKNFGVNFTLFEKISVKGSDQHPLFQWLKAQSGEEPKWNFSKYLIDEEGNVMGFYPSGVNPMDDPILSKL
jgi:glutathione peroxidase